MFSQRANSKKETTKTKKSTKSSEQVDSFQKSLHERIHFPQYRKNQVFGIKGQVWVFFFTLAKKFSGKPGKNVRLTMLLLFLAPQWLLTILWEDVNSLARHKRTLRFDNFTSFQNQLKNHSFQESSLDIHASVKLVSTSVFLLSYSITFVILNSELRFNSPIA